MSTTSTLKKGFLYEVWYTPKHLRMWGQVVTQFAIKLLIRDSHPQQYLTVRVTVKEELPLIEGMTIRLDDFDNFQPNVYSNKLYYQIVGKITIMEDVPIRSHESRMKSERQIVNPYE